MQTTLADDRGLWRKPEMDKHENDHPIPFAWKRSWIAMHSTDGAAVVESLKLENVERCTWATGLERSYRHEGVLVTPPIDEWTVALGSFGDAGKEDWRNRLERLSDRFQKAFYFGTHRIVGYQAWAVADRGTLRRGFCYLGERGEFLLNFGRRTKEEIELGTGVVDAEDPPEEQTVLAVASSWLFDPRRLNSQNASNGPGWFGKRQT